MQFSLKSIKPHGVDHTLRVMFLGKTTDFPVKASLCHKPVFRATESFGLYIRGEIVSHVACGNRFEPLQTLSKTFCFRLYACGWGWGCRTHEMKFVSEPRTDINQMVFDSRLWQDKAFHLFPLLSHAVAVNRFFLPCYPLRRPHDPWGSANLLVFLSPSAQSVCRHSEHTHPPDHTQDCIPAAVSMRSLLAASAFLLGVTLSITVDDGTSQCKVKW